MKKLLLIILSVVLFAFSQGVQASIGENESYTLSGVIRGELYSDYIFLSYGKVKDSVKVVDNKFEFKGRVDWPIQGWLNLRPEPDASVQFIYIENSKIEIVADFRRRLEEGRNINMMLIKGITGSHSALIQEDFRAFCRVNQEKENFNSLLYVKLQTFLKENSAHPFSGTLVADYSMLKPIFTRSEILYLYSLIDTTHVSSNDMGIIKKGIAAYGKYAPGEPFVKFRLPDTNDKEVDIESFKGKTMLVDFWASWCGPCRAKHPDLINLKNKFIDEDFGILSISLDTDKEAWRRAIEKDKLSWTNLIDVKKDVSNELAILAIPFNYLIDKNGNVLGINLKMEQIDKILREKATK